MTTPGDNAAGTSNSPGTLMSDQCDCDCSNCDCACLPDSQELLRSYYVELTSDCNNNCQGCGNVFVSKGGVRHIMNDTLASSTSQTLDILSRILPKAKKVNLTGGEPTLHPDFFEIIEFIARENVPFTIFTNGRWKDPEKTIDCLKSIPSFKGLLISLHGVDDYSHSFFSGVVGSFKEVTANILAARSAGLSVSMSTVITSVNWSLIDQLIELSQTLDVNQVVFNRYIGAMGSAINPATSQLRMAFQTIEERRQDGAKVKFGPCIPTCFVKTSAGRCGAGRTFVTIDPWGNIRPCNHTPHIFGNLLNASIEEIWNSLELKQWYEKVPAGCENCPLFSSCGGGCKVLALSSEYEKDPLVARATTSVFHGLDLLNSWLER